MPNGETLTALVEFVHANGDINLSITDGMSTIDATSMTDNELAALANSSGSEATFTLEVIGDPSKNTSYFLSNWRGAASCMFSGNQSRGAATVAATTMTLNNAMDTVKLNPIEPLKK